MTNLHGDDYRPHLSPRNDSMNSVPEERPAFDHRQSGTTDPAVLPVSERTPLIGRPSQSIEAVSQSQAARQQQHTGGHGIGRIRMSVGDANRWSASRPYDSEFGCRGEIWINVISMIVFCLLYGFHWITVEIITDEPSLSYLSNYKMLIITAVHVIQFFVVFLQFIRANYWSGKMKKEGYLTLPSDLATARKAGVLFIGFSSTILPVLLALPLSSFSNQLAQYCYLVVLIYLGVECLIYVVISIVYLVRIARYRRHHLWPDVVNEAARENLDLSHGGTGGRPGGVGPILTITDELRIGEDYELTNGEDVFESQTALIGYLKHRNGVLSEKLHTLYSQMHESRQHALPPPQVVV